MEREDKYSVCSTTDYKYNPQTLQIMHLTKIKVHALISLKTASPELCTY